MRQRKRDQKNKSNLARRIKRVWHGGIWASGRIQPQLGVGVRMVVRQGCFCVCMRGASPSGLLLPLPVTERGGCHEEDDKRHRGDMWERRVQGSCQEVKAEEKEKTQEKAC